MRTEPLFKAGAIAALAATVLVGASSSPRRVKGIANDDEDNQAKIQRGFEIAPVTLNLSGKDRDLVGLGSYIVNAQADCNGCHSSPESEFAPDGNPYFGDKTKVNPATYLGGGRDFGPYPAPDSLVHIISRNLTPDKTGLPEGGHTFAQFLEIIRTGVDMDHLHPTCSATVAQNCLPPPFRGDLLQIMPWPIFRNMTDHDLRAIYEYLSAIPCVEGSADPTNPLHNDCQ